MLDQIWAIAFQNNTPFLFGILDISFHLEDVVKLCYQSMLLNPLSTRFYGWAISMLFHNQFFCIFKKGLRCITIWSSLCYDLVFILTFRIQDNVHRVSLFVIPDAYDPKLKHNNLNVKLLSGPQIKIIALFLHSFLPDRIQIT